MAIPVLSKSDEIAALVREAKFLRSNAASGITAMAAGPVSANAIINTCQRYNASKVTIWAPALASSGLMTALADQLRLADANAATAAVQAVIDAIDDVIAWVVTNFPKNTGTTPLYILKDTLNADGSISVRTFSTAQTADLRTELQKIVDAIGA